MSAPERIWVYRNGNSQTYLTAPSKFHNVEFVRADIAASQLAEARAEAERWAAQALKEEECRIAWQAERDRLAARLSEYNCWPDPLQSPQAEAIRNGKIDMTEIVSLFDKMERELEQLRLMAGERDRLAADNARLRERENAAREFVKRHPALTLIDLAEFEAFLKIPETLDALAGKE